MSKKSIITVIAIFLTGMFSCEKPQNLQFIQPAAAPEGTALIITGAAARISHEIALVERLEELGELDEVSFLSGTSAGAILTLCFNAVHDPSRNFEWDDLKQIFFKLKQEDIFANPRNELPIDTRGAWNFFDDLFAKRLNYQSISKDLIIPSCMTSVQLDNRHLVRVSNIPEMNSITDKPVEGVMTSTSFPVVFPSIRIDGVDYVDGGLSENIPYSAVLEYQAIRGKPFEKIIIVSFQKNTTIEWKKELSLLFLKNKRERFIEKILEASGFSLDANVGIEFLEELKFIHERYPDFASRTLVYTPKVANPPYFATFDFDGKNAEIEYNLVREWAQNNKPVPLEEFIKQ